MQYMRAHGNTPGPTQRPKLTGALSSLLAEIPALPLLWWSGALGSLAAAVRLNLWLTIPLHALVMMLAAVLYGQIFKRAANDHHGGWLFGISYGFLLWMVGPVTVLQWIISRPVATGLAAMGMLGAQLVFGLMLGLLFPWVHCLLQRELSEVTTEERKETRKEAREEMAGEPREKGYPTRRGTEKGLEINRRGTQAS